MDNASSTRLLWFVMRRSLAVLQVSWRTPPAQALCCLQRDGVWLSWRSHGQRLQHRSCVVSNGTESDCLGGLMDNASSTGLVLFAMRQSLAVLGISHGQRLQHRSGVVCNVTDSGCLGGLMDNASSTGLVWFAMRRSLAVLEVSWKTPPAQVLCGLRLDEFWLSWRSHGQRLQRRSCVVCNATASDSLEGLMDNASSTEQSSLMARGPRSRALSCLRASINSWTATRWIKRGSFCGIVGQRRLL